LINCVAVKARDLSHCFQTYQFIIAWRNNNCTLTEVRSVRSAANPVSGPEMQQLLGMFRFHQL